MQNYLNVSCIAWNISLLPKNEQEISIDFFIKIYMKKNPGIYNIDDLKHDIKLLIKSKCDNFPKEKHPIESALIKEYEDEYKITVFSYN